MFILDSRVNNIMQWFGALQDSFIKFYLGRLYLNLEILYIAWGGNIEQKGIEYTITLIANLLTYKMCGSSFS